MWCVLLLAIAAAGRPAEGADGQKSRSPVVRVQVLSATYVGNIQGAAARASVSFEQLPRYVVMAGQIQSGQFSYTFRADLVGPSGFGEIVSHGEGTRFQIRIDLTQAGFALTSNPFGPGTPTTYYFSRR
jgi:hypothetical protein